jgi:2-haloacid dehalogenase
MNFANFTTLTFDCYGTLIDWETGIFSVLRPMLAMHGKSISDAELLELYSELEPAAQNPYRTYREVLETVVYGFGERLGFQPSPQEARSLPDSMALWRPFPDTVAALQRLKSRFRLGIISNVDDDLFVFSAPQLSVPFDYVITAEQAQAYKPSLRIFELALQITGETPAHILHVGQSLYHDVIPAQSLGLSTVWVNRPSPRPNAGAVKVVAATPDLEVHTLAELADAAVPHSPEPPSLS